jgi:hypothetical protein
MNKTPLLDFFLSLYETTPTGIQSSVQFKLVLCTWIYEIKVLEPSLECQYLSFVNLENYIKFLFLLFLGHLALYVLDCQLGNFKIQLTRIMQISQVSCHRTPTRVNSLLLK